ncbi:cobalamin biosynthesis protein CbiM, partial [Corynebacterium amycolatum]|nr:cobalamin biosynthesis protein CbiM [Corynebacterium amycolatum]
PQIPLAIIEALVTVILMRTLLAVAHSELLDLGFLSRFGDAPAPALEAKAAEATADAVAGSVTSQNAAAASVSGQKQ